MLLTRIIHKVKMMLMTKKSYIKYLRKQGVKIGDNCDIDKQAYFGSEPWLIKIGSSTRITRGVQFITHDGGLWTLRRMGLIDKEDVKYGTIEIGDNCNISWNVIIMPNVKIGNNCVVAAGAVVTKDIPDNSVWGGVPAKHIETIYEYADKVRPDCVRTCSLNQKEKRTVTEKLFTDKK